jgi:peptidoglycan/LPS O-acetylase OafA/YrhL
LAACPGVLRAEPAVRAIAWLSAHPDTNQDAFFTRIYLPTYLRLDGLTVGVALAAISRFHPAMWARIARPASVLFFGGVRVTVLSMAVSFDPLSFLACSVGFSLFSLAFGMLVASALHRASWLGRIRVVGVKGIALLSYAMYLTHVPALDAGYYLGTQVLHTRSLAIIAPLQAVLVFLGAGALHAGIERPVMRLRENWLRSPLLPEPEKGPEPLRGAASSSAATSS